MKLTTVLSLAPLLGAATAQDQQGQPFTLNIRWSNSPLTGPVNANGGSFYTGKPTTVVCPENVPEADCPPVNTTSFVAQGSKLFLNAAVPGGQQVYISPSGRLTYTLPHSGYIPYGSLTDLPIFANSFLNPLLTLWLCADDSGANAWTVWAEYTNATTGAIMNNGSDGTNACTRIMLEAEPYHGPMGYLFWTHYDAILKRGD
ncbi:hypothetical protein CNMCM6106_003452 [Aspergillus hiratsukae]|uniref:IgE-binding protein n=1 Tax=Aspergillus hiratsukae TaxID=1194566 RepID=A0A8H6UV76_9EURO|nr:hypothetical protein CNMCM6106_003452 [Aspergillus hiratsukae]